MKLLSITLATMLFGAGMSQKAKYLEIKREISPHFLMDEGLTLRDVEP
jgi:hypothetical protein